MSKLMFLKLQKEDLKRIQPMLSCDGEYSCTLSFANLMSWREMCKYEIAVYNNTLIIKMDDDGVTVFSLPIGSDFDGAMQALIEYCTEKNIELRFWATDGNAFNKFYSKYKNNYIFEEARDSFEYIYNSQDLITLSGKKYHSKRNHISAFTKMYSWEYEPLCADNAKDALDFMEQWYRQNAGSDHFAMKIEKQGAEEILSDIDSYNVKGAIVRVDGAVAAFTMGCEINENVFDIMVEKALTEYVGAYAFINNIFAAKELFRYKYINREDDLGLEGLRKAKLSYKPEILLKKYNIIHKVTVKNDAVKLFCDSFNDEDNESAQRFINEFFDCGLYKYNGSQLASMLFLLPSSCDGKKMLYLYGAATREDLRGRGYITALIEKAKEYAAANEYTSIFLRPSDKKVERLYENCGFTYTRFACVYEAQLCDINEDSYVITLAPSASKYENIRKQFLSKGDIYWDARIIKLALDNGSDAPCSAFYGTVFGMEFCCVCEKKNDTLFIRELFGELYDKVCNALMSFTGCNKCIALIKADNEGVPHTMECFLDGSTPERKGYTGIALD